MPSPRADAAPVTHRRQRLERTVGAPAPAPEVELFTPCVAVLPPGVVDTRPPGMRMIDIREAVLDVQRGERAIEVRHPEVRPSSRRRSAARRPEVQAFDASAFDAREYDSRGHDSRGARRQKQN